MLDAMKRHLPPEAAYLVPKGGLYFWVNLPEGMDAGPGSRLFEAAFERGMIYVPGEFCYCPEPGVPKPRNCLRLSFGCVGEQQIREGVRRLGEAIRSVLA
jgi:2-aminoadipate transaminase